MVVRTLALVVVRRVLGLVGLVPAPDAKDIEIAVLRHQLMVLRRQVARPRYTPRDRLVLVMLARLLPRERWAAFLVTPSTLLRWHRELVTRRWTYPPTGRRRGLAPEIADLVVRMARENPRWGYLRIVGECRKLASGYQPPRCGGSCAGTGSGRRRAVADRAGVNSSTIWIRRQGEAKLSRGVSGLPVRGRPPSASRLSARARCVLPPRRETRRSARTAAGPWHLSLPRRLTGRDPGAAPVRSAQPPGRWSM
jgi:hypothetical protein